MLKNMKLKFTFLLVFICLSTSAAFGLEDETEIPLPSDKSAVIWKNIKIDQNGSLTYFGNYIEGDYSDKIGNQYSIRIYPSNPQRIRTDFFATKLYKLFGFPSLPQRLVEANIVARFNTNPNDLAIITKLEPDLKPLSDCSQEDMVNIQEPLAKLHLISALISNYISSPSTEKEEDCGMFVRDGKIYVVHAPNSFGYNEYRKKKYTQSADDFKKLLEPQHDWATAKIFQPPFQTHTLKDPQKFITWLESSWDENKTDTFFKESGLEDQELLANLKLRFQDLIKRLEEIKRNGYELYSSKKITKLIEEKARNNKHYKLVYKNIYYEFKSVLPKTEEQMFICTDGNKVWFELTNYEFLVNGEKSNKIIKVYIGKVSSGNTLNTTEKYALGIFDPETAYVFMKAILGYWDSLPKNRIEADSILDLAQTLQAGYQEIFYHFDFSNTLESKDMVAKISSFKELIEFWQLQQEQYAIEAKRIGRLVTADEIEKRKKQGFNAYYPNPVYLDDIAIYKRPSNMSYAEYIENGKEDLREDNVGFNCDKTYLAKTPDTSFDYCDEYNKVLEKIYPDDVIYLNNTEKFHFSDFNRVKNVYAFRGEDRSMDEIYDAGGIWPRVYLEPNKPYSTKEDKKKLLEDTSRWEMRVSSGTLHPGGGPYVSTSRILAVTKDYGKQVYVVLANGGLVLPADINGRKIDDITLREIAVPGGIDWENVIGVREREKLLEQENKKYPIGPVYLKENLAKEDPKNFWEILQIMGGKSQCFDSEFSLDIAKDCACLLDNTSKSDPNKIWKKFITHYQQVAGLSEQEMRSLLPKRYLNSKNWPGLIGIACQIELSGMLGLETGIPR